MTSPRHWLVVSPDLTNTFNPTDEYVNQEWVEQTQAGAICRLIVATNTIQPSEPSSFSKLHLELEMDVSDYKTMRANRTDIVEYIKQVLKNSLIPRKRGKRVFALKRPIVVLDKHINRYKVIFDAIVSNTVHFSRHRFTTLTDVSMRNDIEQEFIHYNQHDLLIDCECELVV